MRVFEELLKQEVVKVDAKVKFFDFFTFQLLYDHR